MEWIKTISDDLVTLTSGDFMVRENYDTDDWDLFHWDRHHSSGPQEELIDLAEELDRFN